ncbi:MAG: 1-deoxy-D-xylulose-5-phosphate reductoisomerase [Paludibacteraceae bacterium]|nr:1-deoxy-D-xylulose-5-phosphate reductoisomerase [Paludibacteraceae bacterium]
MRKQIAILGSTGSIGTQALDVIERNPEQFQVYAISANKSIDKLVEQARRFRPEVVCIADETLYEPLRDALSDIECKVWAGADSIAQMVTMPSIDIVLASMVGYAGLKPTIEAIKAGKTIALANKETLVVAGELICKLANEYHTPILPVDSEHSAIFQSIVGEGQNAIEKILLTASGGPFRNTPYQQLSAVTAKDALKHPNWDMGAKITIDSATMMNKGFEVIEAKWLFGVPTSKIQVLVHPQSIVHSAVQFEDGCIKAQLGMPDMRMPIQYAFSYPKRLKSDFPRVDFFELHGGLTFEQPDLRKFKNLALAYEAMDKGGNMPCIINAANEVVVQAFLKNSIGFLQMSDIIEKVMNRATFIARPTYEDYVQTDKQVRQLTLELC